MVLIKLAVYGFYNQGVQVKKLIIPVLFLMVLSITAFADPIGLQLEGGGTQQVYQLSNGNFLSLWGLDNREGANPGAGAVTINSLSDFNFISGTVVGVYNGINPINPGASNFDPLVLGFIVSDDARLYDAIWVEWTGGNLVHQRPSGGTSTAGATATLEGDPFRTPEPASMILLGLGIFGVASLSRKRS